MHGSCGMVNGTSNITKDLCKMYQRLFETLKKFFNRSARYDELSLDDFVGCEILHKFSLLLSAERYESKQKYMQAVDIVVCINTPRYTFLL